MGWLYGGGLFKSGGSGSAISDSPSMISGEGGIRFAVWHVSAWPKMGASGAWVRRRFGDRRSGGLVARRSLPGGAAIVKCDGKPSHSKAFGLGGGAARES